MTILKISCVIPRQATRTFKPTFSDPVSVCVSYRCGALDDVPALVVARLEPEPLAGALPLAQLPLKLLLVRLLTLHAAAQHCGGKFQL